jgi:VanZ family protein
MRGLVSLTDRHWLATTVAALLAVTALSLSPLPELPLPDAAASDKLHHVLAYAILALPVSVARPRGWLWILAFILAWSGLIELAQPFVNRHRDLADMAANGTGLLLGIVAGAALRFPAQ